MPCCLPPSHLANLAAELGLKISPLQLSAVIPVHGLKRALHQSPPLIALLHAAPVEVCADPRLERDEAFMIYVQVVQQLLQLGV